MHILSHFSLRVALLVMVGGATGLLSGCLEDASDSASNENSFSQIDGTDPRFSDSSSGGVSNGGDLDRNQLRVSVQVPDGIADGEAGRRNLLTTTDADLNVTRVDKDLRTVEQLDPRIRTEGNAFILTFRDRERAPSDVDLVVTATVDGETFRAPLAAGSRHVRLNPFTDYLVNRVIGDELSNNDINDLKGCEDNLCPQALIWSPLVDQVHNFEIDIPSNSTAGQARDFLDERADFADFVTQATEALTLDQDRISSLEGSVDTSTTNFNTTYFGASLNLDRTENTPFWASRTISRGESSSNGGDGFAYPSLTLTSFAVELFDLSVTSLASDVPYVRNSAGFSDLDGVTNTHSTSPGPAFIRDDKTLIASRPMLQSITREGGATTGWAPDPHFLAGYLLADKDDPEALMSSYFHAGKTLSLTETETDRYDRDETLEDQATSSLEINLPQWEDEDGSEIDPESDYNLAAFELIPADDESGGLERVRATLGAWTDGNGGSFEEDTTVGDGVVWELTNDDLTDSNTNPYEDSLEVSAIDVTFSSDDDKKFRGHTFYNHGDGVDIQGAGGEVPNGAISPDHRWMAFSARTENATDTGDFIRIAHHHGNDDDIKDGRDYRLVGFDVTLDDEERLEQLNGSCMEVGSGNTDLKERGLRVSRTTSSTGSYTAPESFENSVLTLDSIPDNVNSGRFSIEGPDDTVINGFVADEGKTLVMLKKTGQSLGIMLGFREDGPGECPAQ